MPDESVRGFRVAQGDDRFGENHDLGAGRLTFKVTTADSRGSMVVVELQHHTQGGPPRHRHLDQDEWFSVIEGTYVVEVGDERFELHEGDSAFGPRDMPHTWAHVGDRPGRIALAIAPAGEIEPFLRALSVTHDFAPQDPAFWPSYGMELVGPPIAFELGSTSSDVTRGPGLAN